ncbi:MAG TPA: hypothetical protein VLJ37_06260 [bacterium]|nr:hypothetical protein [bacterium]
MRTCLTALGIVFAGLAFFSGGGAGCGGGAARGTVNANFEDVSEAPVTPAGAIDPDDTEMVTVVEPGPDDQGGKIGTVADQDPSHVLCVIIDPSPGEDADLEVCESDQVNTETASVEGLCPDADRTSRCASRNAGDGPDFCQVTGAADYAFVLMNLTPQTVSAAYRVVDVTGYPAQSCADLNITENSIRADEL